MHVISSKTAKLGEKPFSPRPWRALWWNGQGKGDGVTRQGAAAQMPLFGFHLYLSVTSDVWQRLFCPVYITFLLYIQWSCRGWAVKLQWLCGGTVALPVVERAAGPQPGAQSRCKMLQIDRGPFARLLWWQKVLNSFYTDTQAQTHKTHADTHRDAL